MSTDNAKDYADSLVAGIEADCEAGNPFGISEGYGDTPEGEPVEAYDYLEDVLDIQYIVNSDRTYRGARILVGFGGPNVWINTQTGNLEVSWWSAPEYRGLPTEFITELDNALEELWEMGA